MNDKNQPKKSPLESSLTEQETVELARIASSEIALSAIQKVCLFGIYYNGTLKKGEVANPLMNFALRLDEGDTMSNEQLGARLRGKTEGVVALEVALREIIKFKPLEAGKPEPKVNKAR